MNAPFSAKANRPRRPWQDRRAVENVNLTMTRPPSVDAAYINVAGRGRAYAACARDWIALATIEIIAQRPGCVVGPYHLSLQFERSNALQDVWNYEKLLSDLLTKLGVVQDDRFCVSGDLTWMGKGDRAFVRITSHRSAA